MRIACAIAIAALSVSVLGAGSQAPRTFSKHVLAWADVRNGYQHESITHALSTIERLGWESGLYDTVIRTDSQSITKSPILFRQGTGIASGPSASPRPDASEVMRPSYHGPARPQARAMTSSLCSADGPAADE